MCLPYEREWNERLWNLLTFWMGLLLLLAKKKLVLATIQLANLTIDESGGGGVEHFWAIFSLDFFLSVDGLWSGLSDTVDSMNSLFIPNF